MAMNPSTRKLIELLRRYNSFGGYDCRSKAGADARKGAAYSHRSGRQTRGRSYTRDLVANFTECSESYLP
jgi:hypothetical protein